MTARKPWTPEDDQQLRTLAEAGLSHGQISREMPGRTVGSIASRKSRLGIRSDHTGTAAANEARRITAKERRTRLENKLLEDAERIREQLWQSHTYFDWGGKDHDFAEHTVSEPTPSDKLKLMQAAGAAIDRSLKISTHDTDSGVAEANSLLDQFAATIGAVADATGLDETEEP